MEAFQSLVERLDAGACERSLVYTGLRGVGKTVLLMEFDVLASEAGWATTDVQEVGSSPDFRTTFARKAARLLMNMSRRHRAKQMGVLFLIDEMQNLDGPALGATCMAFQAISRAGLPVTMVDAGLPDLRVRLLAAKPYADRLFSYAEIGRLSESAAWQALVGPASTAGVDYDEKTARQIANEAAGFPHFLQEYGRELWNFAETTPIISADHDWARPIVKDPLARNFFGTRFELATDTAQKYFGAMASLGSGPYPVAAVANAFGAPDQRRVSMHRDSLIGEGLVWSPRLGQVDFTVPLFDEFIRENGASA